MKFLFLSTMLITTNVFAFGTVIDTDACHVEIEGGVKVSPSEIEFLKNDVHVYKIVDNKTLIVNNNKINLNASQQSHVSSYSNKIRKLIPDGKKIATDAIALASDGINLTFDELLGPNNTPASKLNTYLTEINKQIELSFAADKTIYFNEGKIVGDDFFDENFEDKIETAVKDIVQQSIGAIMIALGQQLFSENGGETFETKMEKFGELLEAEIETRGRGIEKSASSLCEALVDIDRLEEKLKNDISPLKNINVISI